jgi:DNA-binding GntR family transcriptional regulator
MSRTPVREAFLRLEAEGLLRLYPQRGALVVPVSPEEIRAVIEARLVLEQFAAQKVIRRDAGMRGETADALADELVRQRRAGDAADLPEFLDADRLFHATLLDSAQNAILGAVYASLRDRQVRMIGESALRDPRRVDTILAEHERIAAAVRNGDLEEALEAIRVHLTGTARALGLALDTGSAFGTRSDAR